MQLISTHKLYFQNPAGSLFEHPNGYVFFQYAPGKRNLLDFQGLTSHAATLLQRNKWNKVLSDQRLMSPRTEEETAWIRDNWLTLDRQRPSTTYAAVILSHDVFARLSINQGMQEASASSITYRVFEHEEQAATWLKQVGR